MLCSYLLSKFIFLVKLELLYLIKFVVKILLENWQFFYILILSLTYQ